MYEHCIKKNNNIYIYIHRKKIFLIKKYDEKYIWKLFDYKNYFD